MFQKIVESLNHENIHGLESGTVISAFEIDLLDEETLGLNKIDLILRTILKNIPDQITVRFYLKSRYSNIEDITHSRTSAINEIGSIKNQALVILEKYPKFNFFNSKKKEIDHNHEDLKPYIFSESSLSIKALSANEIENFFPQVGEEIYHHFQTLELKNDYVTLLRLTKQTEFGMGINTLSHLKDSLPIPYIISCSISPVAQAEAEGLLRRRSKQNHQISDIKENRKYSEAQEDLEAISLDGCRLFRFEWLFLIQAKTEAELNSNREEASRKLQGLGEVYTESFGAYKSLRSFYPGTEPHFSLLEKDDSLLTYLPLITRGDSKSKQIYLPHSLALHRRDESLCYMNIFDSRYESFSWCIFGRPGTGKSVLTNAITRALAFDPNIKIIKIDVGGSHSRETEILGGTEKTLNLNEPTGLNPFLVLTELGSSKEAIQIISSFIEVLILEEGELKLTKTIKADLEKMIQEYAESKPKNPNLENFYNFSKNLPRKNLLSRWVGSGVYGNAFAVTPKSAASIGSSLDSKLIYFNFSKISQALDPDYAQGGLAAVMAQFNLEMLKKDQHKKRIVFIADETPFFIQKCFSFFNLSIANVRKEGHGFITIAQKTSHVVVGGDTGILDNSPNKIFFSMDGDDESFIARTQSDTETVQKIKSLTKKQGEYSEALLKDNLGERVVRIQLSPFEYWSYTSKDEDRKKFNELKSACPSLNMKEIIRCLSLS